MRPLLGRRTKVLQLHQHEANESRSVLNAMNGGSTTAIAFKSPRHLSKIPRSCIVRAIFYDC